MAMRSSHLRLTRGLTTGTHELHAQAFDAAGRSLAPPTRVKVYHNASANEMGPRALFISPAYAAPLPVANDEAIVHGR